MDTTCPPSGVIPAGHPILAVVWRAGQARNGPFRHLTNLIAVLSAVTLDVLEDPDFLERSLLVDRITRGTSPRDLVENFALRSPLVSVIVRDFETGFSVGLLVFPTSEDCAAAKKMPPRRGIYRNCFPASCHGASRVDILAALELQSLRAANSELLRSIMPPQYLLENDEMDQHLRCIYCRGAAGVSGGAYGLCRAFWDEKVGRGPVLAVIMHRARNAAVLVFDDAETANLLDRRTQPLQGHGVLMLDSSLFPVPPDADYREAPLMRRLLPPFVTDDSSLLSRVLLLTGIDTQYCDAAGIAYNIQCRLDQVCIEDHGLEAVIVQRQLKQVFVVLRSSDDAKVLLKEPANVWNACFGRQISISRVCGFGEPVDRPRVQHQEIQHSQFDSTVSAQAVEDVKHGYTLDLEKSTMGDTRRIAHYLIALCALENPNVVQSHNFSERALLLSGVHSSSSDMRWKLSIFGQLDGLEYNEKTEMALVVFKTWFGADRLLGRSTEAWSLLGFRDCRRSPEVENAKIILQTLVDELLKADSCARHADFLANSVIDMCLTD